MVFCFLGATEIAIILIIALLVFGPQKLPEVGRQIGSVFKEMNRMRGDMERMLDLDDYSHNRYDRNPYDAPSGTIYPQISGPLEESAQINDAAHSGTGHPIEGEGHLYSATDFDHAYHAEHNEVANEDAKKGNPAALLAGKQEDASVSLSPVLLSHEAAPTDANYVTASPKVETAARETVVALHQDAKEQ